MKKGPALGNVDFGEVATPEVERREQETPEGEDAKVSDAIAAVGATGAAME